MSNSILYSKNPPIDFQNNRSIYILSMKVSSIPASLVVVFAVFGLIFSSAIELNAQSKQSSSQSSKKSASKKSGSKKSGSKKSGSKKSGSKNPSGGSPSGGSSSGGSSSGGSSSGGSSSAPAPEMVTVQGGALPTGSQLAGQTVSTFEIGKYEVTWGEWKAVRDWAVANGYSDLVDTGSSEGIPPGRGKGEKNPVTTVSWYDAVKWCNARSEMESIVPVYRNSNGSIYKTSEGEPIALNSANGYRLPTETEWEWAARGGILSQGYVYSGGNNLNSVAVGIGGDQPVGTKIANELGIHDMSGNVSEWVWDSVDPPLGSSYTIFRTYRGGDSFQSPNLEICKVAFRATGGTPPDNRPSNFGFRLARNLEMVTVQGGTLPTGSQLAGQTVSTFEIGKYEVTWGEWKAVRDWAVANNKGYSDLAGVGDTYPSGSADNFPVTQVSWYDVVKWSNARSEKEGLTPVYQVSGATYKTGAVAPTLNASANGYRLPSEKEWEWAARGGVSSKAYTYSGSNTANEVGWEYQIDGTKAVGTKAANELGIYDMSGNVFEWCEDVAYTTSRRFRGGGWRYYHGGAAVADRDSGYYPDFRSIDFGFRLARRLGN